LTENKNEPCDDRSVYQRSVSRRRNGVAEIASISEAVMPILVTGVTGQVGGALLKVLGPANSIVAAGRDQLDLAQPSQIAATLNCIGPDLIVNAAAFTAVDRAEDEKEMVNAEGPRCDRPVGGPPQCTRHPFLHRLRFRRRGHATLARRRPGEPIVRLWCK
jgi:RmlD substrate binding domain